VRRHRFRAGCRDWARTDNAIGRARNGATGGHLVASAAATFRRPCGQYAAKAAEELVQQGQLPELPPIRPAETHQRKRKLRFTRRRSFHPRAVRRHTSRSSTVTSRNTPTHIRRKRSTRVTTPNDRKRSSRAISPGSVRGSNPLSSTRKPQVTRLKMCQARSASRRPSPQGRQHLHQRPVCARGQADLE
jgi:hypothetical protein